MSGFVDKMHQMALLEYRADHDAKITTKNLRNVFGFYSVEPADVRKWFNRFENAKTGKFESEEESDAAMRREFPNGLPQIVNSMVSQFKAGRLFFAMNTYDGRIGYGIARSKFVICDLFHGESRSITNMNIHSPNEYRTVEFVDNHHALLLNKRRGELALFKVDVDALTIERVSVVENNGFRGGCVFLDELNSERFLIRDWPRYWTGNVINNQIVLGEASEYEGTWTNSILRGSELWGLRRIDHNTYQFYKFNLETRNESTVDIPMVFGDGREFALQNYNFGSSNYFWADHKLYVVSESHRGTSYIYVLDTDTREWTDTGIELLNRVYKIHVDRNGVLTAITEGGTVDTIVYRFPLHKPDSLINLSWFSMSRGKKKTGKRGYNSFFKRLPYTCDIHLQLPGSQQADTTQDE